MSDIISKKPKELTAQEVEAKILKAFKVVGSEAILPSKVLEDIFMIRHADIIKKIELELEMSREDGFGNENFRSHFFIESTYKKRVKKKLEG